MTEKIATQSETITFLDEEKGRLLLQLQESFKRMELLKQ